MNFKEAAAISALICLIGFISQAVRGTDAQKPAESTAILQQQIDAQQTEIQQLQGIAGELEKDVASYRLYTTEIAKSLVDLNKQLRESQAECERLERENMRLERRRAMGLVEGDE